MSSGFKLTSFLPQVKKMMREVAKERMTEACIHVQNKVKIKLSGTRTGKIYRVPGTKKFYTASAPGEPPASVTGQYRNSFRFKVTTNKDGVEGAVGSPLKKAPALEFGTKKMAARPSLAPVFQEEKKEIVNILSRKWVKD